MFAPRSNRLAGGASRRTRRRLGEDDAEVADRTDATGASSATPPSWLARHGLASQEGGTPATEVVLDPFRVRLTPSGARREMDVWHAGAGGAKVLSLWWAGDDVVTVVGFRRGAWEQELLALGDRGASPP